MADAYCVDPKIVAEVWPLVSGLLQNAMRRGGIGSFEVLKDDVLSGGALLWVAMRDGKLITAAVTQVNRGEYGKVCEIVACGGRGTLRDMHLITKLEEYARAEKCRAMRIIGRKGWMRALPDYKATRVVLQKELI